MTTQLLCLNNRLVLHIFGIVLSVVMLFAAAQPVRADQRPDTILRDTVEQLLAEGSSCGKPEELAFIADSYKVRQVIETEM